MATVTSLCIYRVKKEALDQFVGLLKRHWPAMKELGLVVDEPPRTWRGEEKGDGPIIFELFTWKDESGPSRAHQMPEVAALWEPMGDLCEERDGRPAMEFPNVEEFSIHQE